MPQCYYFYNKFLVKNMVDNPVIADSNSVTISPL